MRRTRPRIARADEFRQVFVVLDVGHRPDSDTRTVRPAQRRAVQYRRVRYKIGLHGTASCNGDASLAEWIGDGDLRNVAARVAWSKPSFPQRTAEERRRRSCLNSC